MSENALVAPEKNPVGWYEEAILVRGCKLSLEIVKEFYRDLDEINKGFGKQLISTLDRIPDMDDLQWEEHKTLLLREAFCLTITVTGERDQRLYGENVSVFDDKLLPQPIKSIFFTNINSYRNHANGNEPSNRLIVFLDFGKPEVFDPNPLVSAATPNEGKVTVSAQDVAFFNAISNVVEKKILSNKTWYHIIHKNFAYDIGMWILALPLSLYFAALYMDQLIPVESELSLFRWPFFIYVLGVLIVFYRALTAYAKWAFPVNVLVENKDRSTKHRLVISAFTTWLLYQVATSIYENLIK